MEFIKRFVFKVTWIAYFIGVRSLFSISIRKAQQFMQFTLNTQHAQVLYFRLPTDRLFVSQTCLFQSVLMKVVFEKIGRPCQLKIGVRNNEKLQAHAWLEEAGVVVFDSRPPEQKSSAYQVLNSRRDLEFR